ncbi:hypothetical protein [Kitasatospora sp. NPDC004272]
MPQKLSDQQKLVVQDMDAKITALVGRLTTADLRALLVGAAPGGPEEADFGRRFRALSGGLAALGDLVQTEAGLSPSVGANTSITAGANPQLLRLELRPELVESVTSSHLNTLTVLHELSHTLREGGAFPVKDYAYRSEWAWGYLTPALTAVNADSYAELAARLAEGALGRRGRYGKLGPLPAQREHLRSVAGRTVLGAALAWVDLVLNRAWIRSSGALAHAEVDVPDSELAARQRAWSADPDQAALVAFEQKLVSEDLIDARYSAFGSHGLSWRGKGAVRGISECLERAKNLLSRLEVVPVTADGGHVSCDASSGALLVWRGVFGEDVQRLGGRILEAVLAAVAPVGFFPPAYASRLRDIVDWLVENDRPQERLALQPLLRALTALPVPATTAQDWDALAQALPRAILADVATRWQLVATHAADTAALAPEKRKALQHLDTLLRRDVGQATAVSRRLSTTKAEVDALLAAVDAVAAQVVPHFKDEAARYSDLRLELSVLRR